MICHLKRRLLPANQPSITTRVSSKSKCDVWILSYSLNYYRGRLNSICAWNAPSPSIQPVSGTASYFRYFLKVFTLFWPPHAGGRWAKLTLGKGGQDGLSWGRGGGSGSRLGKIRRRRNRLMKKADNSRISGVSLISCRRVCVQALIGSQEQFYRI